MLTYLRERITTEGIRNVALRHVAADDPALPPASTDLVFVCNAYHHLRDRVAYFQKVAGGFKGLAAGSPLIPWVSFLTNG